MSKGSMITLAVLVALLVGGMVVWKGIQKSRAEAEARVAPVNLLQYSKVYKENREYLDGLLREAHAPSFAQAYKSGSLFTPSEWDEQVYVELVFDFLAERAKADGKPEIVPGLPGVHQKPADYAEPVLGGGGSETR
ncbi:MAG: hypothetical protein JNK58_07730 [Phycisphaerae bacterium]|nr:hypothetical protein [Phycisphaerae bacterium]